MRGSSSLRGARARAGVAALVVAAAAHAGEDSGRILMRVPQDTRVTLVHLVSGEEIVLRGRGSTVLRELRAGVWSLRRFDVASERRLSRPLPLGRFAFPVIANTTGYVGNWEAWQRGLLAPRTGVTGSDATAANDLIGCECDPLVLERALEKRADELGDVHVALLCAGERPDAGVAADNHPPYTCNFTLSAEETASMRDLGAN